jgi:cellulose synthase (UDP-forming)
MSMDSPSGRGFRDLPPLSAAQEWAIRVLALVSLAFGLYWLYWRWTETLNPDAWVFSLLLVSAETWGWIGSAFFLFHAWKISDPDPPPPPEQQSVDVFITCYDEPLEIVRRTAIGARAIRYPHRTYVLDDGKRDEIMHMAQELGIGYIRRTGNANAKAGNLNYAISVTSGEFILQLDADHVPLPNIIDRMLGYFTDPKVAFVQSPQDFYNTDSFTHVLNERARSLWEENRIFYSLLQRGKDTHNSTFFCGSCGMLRRAALDSIGGFSTNTIIEDMETSMVLHANGWKSVYHPEALAFGLAPGSAVSFQVQRLRWAQGSMQILRKFNPLFLPGLTPGQRGCYFAANVYPIDGLQKAIFYLTPVIFLYTGMVPIKAGTEELMARLIPYLVLSIGAFELVARGTGWLFIQERYNMAKFFTYIVSLATLFTNKKLKFNVTPKGVTDVPFRTYAPQLILLVLSAIALIWAPVAYAQGWVHYDVGAMDIALWFSAAWVCWNIYFAASVIRLSLTARQQRADHRFIDQFPVRLTALDATSTDNAAPAIVLSRDLNPRGLAFRASQALPVGSRFEFSLPLSTRQVAVTGAVVHVQTERTLDGDVHLHGVQFENPAIDVRDAIELHCTHHAVPMWRKKYRQSLDMLVRATEVVRNARSSFRRAVHLPAYIYVTDDNGDVGMTAGLLEELSSSGARVVLETPFAPGTPIRFEVPGTTLAGRGEVVFSRAFESPMSVSYSLGIRLERSKPSLVASGSRGNGSDAPVLTDVGGVEVQQV